MASQKPGLVVLMWTFNVKSLKLFFFTFFFNDQTTIFSLESWQDDILKRTTSKQRKQKYGTVLGALFVAEEMIVFFLDNRGN